VPLIGLSQTQWEMNENAANKYSETDSILTSIYNKINIEYSEDTLFIDYLTKSQEVWLKLREVNFKLKYPENVYVRQGSIFTLCKYNFLDEITQDRIDFLMPWYIGDFTGSRGDVCSGSIKNIE
jgi:uncharacterized protein YecT (DUF1311 family)